MLTAPEADVLSITNEMTQNLQEKCIPSCFEVMEQDGFNSLRDFIGIINRHAGNFGVPFHGLSYSFL